MEMVKKLFLYLRNISGIRMSAYLDPKLKGNTFSYTFQSLLAIFSLLIILYFLDVFTHSAISASLGSTVFIVFAMPKSKTAKPRNMIGGHLIGSLIGFLCFNLESIIHLSLYSFSENALHKIIIPAFAVGLAIFMMVISDTEHPPAAGTTLGIVIQGWDTSILVVIFITTIILSFFHRLLNPWLKDLL
jgi:CBS-domain-containing membrane protein